VGAPWRRYGHQNCSFTYYNNMATTQFTETLDVQGNGETILFVDDEVKQLRLMQHFLEESGYRVLVAKDGVEAVDLFARRKDEIALVIMDLGLPNMNGSEALKAMRQAAPQVKAIVATAYLPSRAEASEWSAVVLKPYRIDDILKQIFRVLHES
jgi:two-component system cell cycle sensor histidine kinase/response regulator CckA